MLLEDGLACATIAATALAAPRTTLLPISLKLSNFLCYREDVPILQLQDVHVACLCGANGHGKSALLDAMTWALWGKARGQRQEQLIHQGRQEMRVELEFEARGQRYLVRRRYARGRSQGITSLELSVQAGDGYRPITSDTVTATQAHLHQLINMDYDTFVNSAFLLQGRADLLTMATPTQRKEVLGKVLGLGLYDRLEERAKAQARRLQGRLDASAVAVEGLQQQVARRPELMEAQTQTEAELASAQEALGSLQGRLESLRGQVGHLERRREEGQALDQQAERVEARQREAALELAPILSGLEGWRQTLAREREIESGQRALSDARHRLGELDGAFQRVHALEQELAPYERRIVVARTTLEGEVSAQERHLREELVPRAQGLPGLQQQLQAADAALRELGAQEQEAVQLSARHQEMVLELRRLEEEKARLELEGKETKNKLELLDHEHGEGAECPLCGTQLDAEARARLEATYQEQIEDQRRRFREQTGRLKALEQEAGRLQPEAARSKEEADSARRRLEGERERLGVQLQEAERAQGQLGAAQAVLAESKRVLDERRYAEGDQAQATALREQVAALGYSQEAHEGARREVREQEAWEAEHRRLQEARTRLAEDEAALQRVQARQADAAEELERLKETRRGIAVELEELPAYQERLQEVETEHRQAAQRRDTLQGRQGSLAHQLQEVEQAAAELRRQEREREGLVREAGVYAELAQAFGKGGVQALLIEAAIPRLEDEANRLLRRMTDGRMSVKLETQRPRRSPGAAGSKDGAEPIETLDILIADELGTRSYEMFSGGESFRVNFALRIALSKLLAWRAGAPLPTLFIDEGFGTQDAEGRDRILDVLKSIEPDFQRILVITHMDEVKDTFPLRIEVQRTPAGSTFSVS